MVQGQLNTPALPVRGDHLSRSEPPVAGRRSALGYVILWTLTLGIPLAIWFLPLGLDPRIQKALAITAFMIGSWMTHAQDVAISGLIGLYLFWVARVVPFGDAFHGFATTTPWFLFGAILFGLVATKSGLARRLAFMVMRAIGHTYARLLLGIIVADFLLTFIVPSGIARVVTAVAVAPGGSAPSYAHGYYSRDNTAYQEWDAISRDRDAFTRWLQTEVGAELPAADSATGQG